MTPPHQSDASFRVLHTLRCIGVASGDRLATACGLGPHDTEGRLRYLSGEGLVELGPGPFGGWGLTDGGRIAEQALLRAELDLTDARDPVRKCYESFMGINEKLLQVCSDWQIVRLGHPRFATTTMTSTTTPKCSRG